MKVVVVWIEPSKSGFLHHTFNKESTELVRALVPMYDSQANFKVMCLSTISPSRTKLPRLRQSNRARAGVSCRR